jgi:hypothetical protein
MTPVSGHRRGLRATTEGHTVALSLAAVTALLDLADRTLEGGVSELVRRQPFAQGYVESIAVWLPEGISWTESVSWWQERVARLERSARQPLPLTRLPALAGVRERVALALVALPDEDDRFLQVVRELQGVASVEGMPAATVVAALEQPGERVVARALDRLTREHLVEPVPGAPQLRRVATELWAAIRDDDTWAATKRAAAPAGAGAVAHWSKERKTGLRRPLELMSAGRVDTVVVRQVPGADGAAAVAASLGSSLVWLTPMQLRDGPGLALAAALGAVPATTLEPGAGEEAEVPRPDWYDGPLVVLTGVAGGVALQADDRRATVLLDRCDEAERRRLWASLLRRASQHRLDALASSFLVPDGHVRRLATDAVVVAQVEGRRAPTLPDVRVAARRLADHVLETRATRIDNDGLTWDDVVTSPTVRSDLELLELRCRLREVLAVGDRGVSGAGVRALLTGPSGCGKTLAARTLAAVLDRNIYRVDLAAVFDKYVGVTEKILENLLTEAEQLDTVLLLDEGDTFLGTRTDVRSANDRYANLESNFLLQRLETFSGIIVVTTNSPDRIDSAFARRMDASIAFGKPRSAARRQIWSLHLPDGHRVKPAEVAAVADRHRLTGGQIRNAVQHARLLSARDAIPLDAELLRVAVAAEYRKAGAMPGGHGRDFREVPTPDRYVRGMAAAGRRRGRGEPR